MKNIIVFSFRSKVGVKQICCIASGSATSARRLLKSIATIS